MADIYKVAYEELTAILNKEYSKQMSANNEPPYCISIPVGEWLIIEDMVTAFIEASNDD